MVVHRRELVEMEKLMLTEPIPFDDGAAWPCEVTVRTYMESRRDGLPETCRKNSNKLAHDEWSSKRWKTNPPRRYSVCDEHLNEELHVNDFGQLVLGL